ncbi:hypothetical protein BFP76_00225 [Amylibacter kogurei]|uniref:DUF3833 domain-containing protein n=1 Tax=Paramylibacter kogurei TaxID=1889778 RepID=A0A2G5K7U3_9RHOB|nr:DUF3833 domain-containing protein [Amylibacter kogurei]PIB25606.1 hypothetical protein BFP76_00225 [Amylibacter kogurei]
MKLVTFILLLILALITVRSLFLSFRSQSPSDYAQMGPEFVLKEHLSGRFQSEGLIYGPNGKVTNTFVAVMNAEWDGDTGTMTEDFTYSNGTTQQRKWYLTAGDGNTFTATADDIVGKATGVLSGATVMLNYKITLPDAAGGYTLSATDWLYLTQDGVIMNKSEMRKFGIKVAELIATMRRE